MVMMASLVRPRSIAGLLAAAPLLALGTLAPRTIRAQDTRVTTDSSASGARARPREPMFTLHDAALAGGFALATAALFPMDARIAGTLQDPDEQSSRFLHHASTSVELLASPGAYVIGASMYVVGRLGHFERLTDLGWHGTEAVLVSDVATGLLKGLTGRQRPYVSAERDADDFGFGRGFRQMGASTSFPSGHTATAFAAASAVTAEVSHWWPRSTWIVGPAMYGGATLVGLSRMYHNRHWASDVALGAAIGTFSGLETVRYAHANPHNRLDRMLLHTTVAGVGQGGLAVGWTLPMPR